MTPWTLSRRDALGLMACGAAGAVLGCALPEGDGEPVITDPDVCWLRAGVGWTLDGSNRIVSWVDPISGADFAGPATDADKPIAILDEPLVAGPVAHYVDSGDHSVITGGVTQDLASGTITIVGTVNTISGNRIFFSDRHLSAPGGGTVAQHYVNASATWAVLHTSGAPTFKATPDASVVAVVPYVLTYFWNTTTRGLKLNEQDTVAEARTNNARTLPRGYIGRDSVGGSYLSGGKIAEVRMWSYVLDGLL